MKSLLRLMCLVVLAFGLSGCGGNDDKEEKQEGTKESGTASADSGRVEITYWYAFGDKIGENNENLVKQFNESQDEVLVKAEFQGNYADLHSKTQAAFAAKNAPEVTLNEIASMGIFARSGMTQDLTPFIEKDPDVNIEDFNPGLMGNSYIDDKIYGLPYLRSTPILYMNVDKLKEAGLDPAGPKNWEEFENYLRALTKGDTVGMSMPVDIWIYEAFVRSSAGEMLSEDETEVAFNGSAGVDALSFWQKLKKEGVIKIPAGDEASAQAAQDFANGRSAMIFGSTAGLTNNLAIAKENGFELNTAFIPANKVNGVPTGGANMVMTAGLTPEKQEAAWKFIKWMTAKEQTIYASKYTGYLPSRLSAVDSEEMQALYQEIPQYKVAVDQLEYGKARPMADAYPEITKILVDEITKSLLDDSISAQEALDKAAERAQPLLKK